MYDITLIPGDGIGPEITAAVRKVLDCSGVKINWHQVEAGEKIWEQQGNPLPEEVINSIKKNKIALKGPITTPIGKGFKSVNVTLRKELGLYANLRPIKSLRGVQTAFNDVDLVVVRENTEDLYIGLEKMITPDRAEALKIITRQASMDIAAFAFNYAKKMGRKKVTAVHKANILKCSDGLFLQAARDISAGFPEIEYEEMIIDNLCMQLVQKPHNFDVLVLPNLYGDIVSDLCAGLVGGLGIVPGANIGEKYSVFEAVHGSAPDIAGRNIANPLALLQSAVLMLQHLKEEEAARKVFQAILHVLSVKERLTPDLGGKGTTTSLAEDICSYLSTN